MTTTLLIETALKSLLTSGLALVLLSLLRSRSAAERSWIAHLGLLATVLLPVAALLGPSWRVAPPKPVPHPSAILPAPLPELPAPAAVHETAAAGAAHVQPALDLHLGALAALAYAIPAALLLAVTAVAVLRLFALRARAAVLVEQPWLSALAHAQRRMGFKNGAALLVSDELRSPVSWGLFRPTIVVNEELLQGGAEAEAIIAHELAHVARLDWVKLLLARAATAVFWFNPLVWILANQCHQLREEAADDAVIQAEVSRTDYAALLVGAARHESRGLLLAANGVAPNKGSLKRRVVRVLDGAISRRPARLGWTAVTGLAALAFAGPLAALTTEAAPKPRPVAAHPIALAIAEPQALPPASLKVGPPRDRKGPSQAPDISPVAPQVDTNAMGQLRINVPAKVGDIQSPISAAASAALGKLQLFASNAPKPSLSARPARKPHIEDDDLVDLRVLGITPDDVREIEAVSPAYADLDADDIVSLHVHGVNAAWLREMKALGYDGLDADEIESMAVQGVGPRYVREMAQAGYRDLTVEQLVSMKIMGVTPAYAAQWTQAGVRLSADGLIKSKTFGAKPPRAPRPDERERPPEPPRPPPVRD